VPPEMQGSGWGEGGGGGYGGGAWHGAEGGGGGGGGGGHPAAMGEAYGEYAGTSSAFVQKKDKKPRRQSSLSSSGSSSSSSSGSSSSSPKSRAWTLGIFSAFLFSTWRVWARSGWAAAAVFVAVLVGGVAARGSLPRRYRRYAHPVLLVVLVAPILVWAAGAVGAVVFGGESSSSNIHSINSGGGGGGGQSNRRNTAATAKAGGGGDASSSNSGGWFSSSSSSASFSSSSSTMTTVKTPIYATVEGEGIMNIVCPRGGKLSSVDFASYGRPSACAGWRATVGCDPEGQPVPDGAGDLPCHAAVPGGPHNGKSGYCECADGSRRFASKCGHAGLPRGCAHECEKVVQCTGWQRTGNCDPHKGATQGFPVAPCDEIVAPHLSGYCVCSHDGGRTTFNVAHSTCDHAPFTCQDKCTKGRARFPPMKSSDACHAPLSRKVVEDHCALGVALCAIDTSHGGYLFKAGTEEGGKGGGDGFACDEADAKKRRLHVRVTCDQQVKKQERLGRTVGEICRGTTDALKQCLEHHIVAEAERCRGKFETVLECQKAAAELGAAG
jgi:hypothetical protein